MKKKKKVMSSKVYVENNGMKCPVCFGKHVRGSWNMNDTKFWSDMRCIDCNSQWEQVYKISGYRGLVHLGWGAERGKNYHFLEKSS